MNKLRKPPHSISSSTTGTSQSRTMMLAQATSVTPSKAPTPWSGSVAWSSPAKAKPVTPAEQYWAARALTAEALLSVKAAHHEEVRTLAMSEETRRSTEVTRLNALHETRQARLERLAVTLLAIMLALVGAIIYLVSRESPSRSHRSGPLHFTIPILSPFASVVEQETSVIGSKVITVFALVAATLAYGCFRYWLSHRVLQN